MGLTRSDWVWVVAFALLAYVAARLFEFTAAMTVGAIIGTVLGRTAYAWYARRSWH